MSVGLRKLEREKGGSIPWSNGGFSESWDVYFRSLGNTEVLMKKG